MKKGKVLALLSLSVLTLGVVGGTVAHESGFISGLEAGVVDQSSKDCKLTFTGNNLVNEGEKTYLLDGYTKLRVNGTIAKKGSQLIAEPGTIIYTDGTQYNSSAGTAGSVLNGLKQLDSVFVGEVNIYVGYSAISEAALKQVEFSDSQKSFVNGITSLTFKNNVAPRYLAIQVVKQTTFKNIKPVATMESVDLQSSVLPKSGTYKGTITTTHINDIREHANKLITVNKDKTIDFVEYNTADYTFKTLKLHPVEISGSNDYVTYFSNPDDANANSYKVTNPTTGINIECLEANDILNGETYGITFDGKEHKLATYLYATDRVTYERVGDSITIPSEESVKLRVKTDATSKVKYSISNKNVATLKVGDKYNSILKENEVNINPKMAGELDFVAEVDGLTLTIHITFTAPSVPSTSVGEFRFADNADDADNGWSLLLTINNDGSATLVEQYGLSDTSDVFAFSAPEQTTDGTDYTLTYNNGTQEIVVDDTAAGNGATTYITLTLQKGFENLFMGDYGDLIYQVW